MPSLRLFADLPEVGSVIDISHGFEQRVGVFHHRGFLVQASADAATCGFGLVGSTLGKAPANGSTVFTIADEPTRVIAVGGTATGLINTSGDVDNFTVSLVAGQTYTISLQGTGDIPLSDAYLTILKPNGTVQIIDDDGGTNRNSLVTFTASTSGTYTISAEGYPGDGLTGGYTLDVRQMGSDAVGSTIASASPLALGQTVFGFVENSRDIDMYSVTLEAGKTYTFEVAGGADYNSNPSALPGGELDTRMTLYNSAGSALVTNDDITYPEDVSSAFTFSPTATGTYYLKVDAYRGQTGGYTINAAELDLSSLDPLDSIDWGTQLSSSNATVYFAPAGETYDGVTSLGWSQYEIDRAMAAFQEWADVANLTFTITNNAAAATFKLVTTTSTEFLGYFNPPGTTNAGVGVFATNGDGWNTTGGLETGGYGFITLVHEFGHGLGLAHPHDDGGTSTVMPGVTGPFDSYGVYDLNQGVYTTMSYNDGWPLDPNGAPGSLNYGYQSGPSALDIAVVQAKYGAPSANTGDNIYYLPTSNAAGTYWDVIWDTGGTDAIAFTGTVSATIDLTAATLDYSPTGGGVISYANGIFGGYTIAAGVVIENATGGSGADLLIGNDAVNTLDGGAGNDTLQGRGGNDIFLFGMGDGNDTVTDLAAGDTVLVADYASAQSVTQSGADVVVTFSDSDRITFFNTDVATVQAALEFPDAPPSGPTEGDDMLTGTSGNDTIDALGGNDSVDGLGGDDFLNGGAGNDVLNGGPGNDTLYGGAGVDTMSGGEGDDIYYLNMAGDTVIEAANAGYDSVLSPISATLPDNVEQLELSGSASLSGTGNALANVLYGNGGANSLFGLDGDDFLNGRGGNDTLYGGIGNDTFGDTAGDDVMYGGVGDDTYYVNSAGDSASENPGEGLDRVVSAISWALGAELETLELTGTNANGTGNALANTILGSSGANILSGLGGDDLLDGRAGADTLIGGTGNDTYVVDNAGDVVTEAAGEGTDTVMSSVTFTLGQNVEDIELIGRNGANATGNELANDMLGNVKNNILAGLGGNDFLNGGSGNDTLNGGEGNDILYGGPGNDAMSGGSGDDIYYLSSPSDTVIENANEGYDSVMSPISATLAANVEKLELSGNDNLSGTGNGLNNALFGNGGANLLLGLGGNDFLNGRAGNDTLAGGAGTDTLTGGAGNDTFQFTALADSTLAAPDQVTDFASGDLIDLAAIDADSGLAGDQAFAFIGANAFSGTAGELRLYQDSGHWLVAGDVDGDGLADFLIQVASATPMTSGDILL